MFRLLSFAALAMLLLLLVCGGLNHKAPTHTAHLDRLELPPAVSSSTGPQSAPDIHGPAISVVDETPRDSAERFRAALPESITLGDPLTISSILRV